jgi:hypothetical protein
MRCCGRSATSSTGKECRSSAKQRARSRLAPAPFLYADGGRLSAGASPASPRDHQGITRGRREEQPRLDALADTRDVQPIGVQTREHRHVCPASGPPRMAVACLEQKSESRIVEIDPAAPTPREGGCAGTMLGIRAVGRSAGIVEYREQLHHSRVGTREPCEPPPVLQHPAPVGDAMDAVRGKPVLLEDHSKKPLCDASSFESLLLCHVSMGIQDSGIIKTACENGMAGSVYVSPPIRECLMLDIWCVMRYG